MLQCFLAWKTGQFFTKVFFSGYNQLFLGSKCTFSSHLFYYFLNHFIDPQLFLAWLPTQREEKVTHKILYIVAKKPEFNEGHSFFSNLEFLILKPTDSVQPFHRTYTIQPLEKRRLREDLMSVYKYLKRRHREDEARLFSVLSGDRTGGKGHKLKPRKFSLNIRKHFLL